jgi:lysine/arginine/ornithine transport system substrate-binding protein
MKLSMLSSLVLLAALPLGAFAQDPHVIRFGVDATYPPFESKAPSGEIVGFDVDLGNAICADMHAKCVWVEQGFDAMIPALKARKFDAILSAMSATEVRRQQIDFTNKLYSGPSRLVAASGSNLLPTAESLKGKRVGVDQGSMQETFAKTVWAPAGVTIVPYQTQDLIYQDLTTGRLDAAFQSAVQADIGFLKTPRGKGYAFAGAEVTDKRVAGDGVAIGVRKDDPELAAKLNRAIADIRKNGTYDKIAAKYFDFNIYGD